MATLTEKIRELDFPQGETFQPYRKSTKIDGRFTIGASQGMLTFLFICEQLNLLK